MCFWGVFYLKNENFFTKTIYLQIEKRRQGTDFFFTAEKNPLKLIKS